ncbi:MAG: Asp-tRNA(Asn)/Glu-tRNA(Gln) amidotransferase subunit GatC [Candidatus Pacebacteria bacterium]|nr:Asp-tRNA(Asn)/Glu-tRNA(Gln) amidotransferase subunit GatC [Candidatus Paceibacterota bacterium]MDD5357088.1 Asp-tRNA(Asn)/Glu-tRNA(Gln) amidotransferase subunit GatC [Candidatus Paceibacterota bacterium]
MISTQDIEKLANLARIELKDDEKAVLAKEIDGILGYIDEIKTAGSKDIVRAKEPVRNVFRDDKDAHESGAHTDALVAEFPRKEGNYLKVKKIL